MPNKSVRRERVCGVLWWWRSVATPTGDAAALNVDDGDGAAVAVVLAAALHVAAAAVVQQPPPRTGSDDFQHRPVKHDAAVADVHVAPMVDANVDVAIVFVVVAAVAM